MFDDWTSKDTATALDVVGNLANAWGDYEVGTERNKIARKALQYQEDQNTRANNRLATAQTNLDDAFTDFATKKKKKKDPLFSDTTDDVVA